MGFSNNQATRNGFNATSREAAWTPQSSDQSSEFGTKLDNPANVTMNFDSIPDIAVSMLATPGNNDALDTDNVFAYNMPASHPVTHVGTAFQPGPLQIYPAYPSFTQLKTVNWDSQRLFTVAQKGRPKAAPGLSKIFESPCFCLSSHMPHMQTYALPRYPRLQQRHPHSLSSPCRTLQPVAILPRKLTAAQAAHSLPGLADPQVRNTKYSGIYSSSGYDILTVLGRVAMRPSPKINIGPADLSCALVLCDLLQDDLPIVYISEAFEQLTGYSKDEAIGRNCRFLQWPGGEVAAGARRAFVHGQTVHRLRLTIDDRSEIQTTILNFRKDGQPFVNLVTMVPIQWDSEEYRYYVGFLVNLVEKSDEITRNLSISNSNHRLPVPQYLIPNQNRGGQYNHDEITTVLNTVCPYESDISRHYLDRIAIEDTDDLVYVLSLSGEFLYLSPSCQRILGYDQAELIGSTLSTICHPSDLGTIIHYMWSSPTSALVCIVCRIRQKYRGFIWLESRGAWHTDRIGNREYLVMTGRPSSTLLSR
ncbi:GATA transcription factor LreA [Penicillium sp. IBT 35674x]|nr:GATA transcription factor LreA [Penicillium sp. IBT 35674x]